MPQDGGLGDRLRKGPQAHSPVFKKPDLTSGPRERGRPSAGGGKVRVTPADGYRPDLNCALKNRWNRSCKWVGSGHAKPSK